MTTFRRVLCASSAVLVAGALAATPGAAAPRDARVVAVFDLSDCRVDPCEVGRDPQIEHGASVRGAVQVHVAARADLSLEWVRLEARYPGDARWWCLEFWTVNAPTFTANRTWHTQRWTDPTEGCERSRCSTCAENSNHRHGDFSENIAHELRVVAHERGAAATETPDDESALFLVRLANPAGAPRWIGTPHIVTQAGRPAVQLEWQPNPEPDIVEYHVIREDPGGSEAEFAVDAAKPTAQGCSAVGNAALRCLDARVPRGGGTVRYAVTAYRRAPSGSGRCTLTPGACVRSPLSAVKTVVLPPAPRAAPTTAGRSTPVPSPGPAAPAALVSVAPSAGGSDQIAAATPGAETGSSFSMIAFVAFLLAGGGMATVLARLRRHSRTRSGRTP